MSDDRDKRSERRALGVLAVPWIMAIAIVLGFLAGRYLDGQLGWPAPVATILLVVLAVATGGYQSYRIIVRILRDKEP
jgi:hypothetical protein